jgi:hypothetical protein
MSPSLALQRTRSAPLRSPRGACSERSIRARSHIVGLWRRGKDSGGIESRWRRHEGEIGVSEKRILPAFLLCFFFGVFGVHRFYVGKVGTGLLQLFTLVVQVSGCSSISS